MLPTTLGQEMKYVDTRDYPFNNFPYEKEQKSLVCKNKNARIKYINMSKLIYKKIFVEKIKRFIRKLINKKLIFNYSKSYSN